MTNEEPIDSDTVLPPAERWDLLQRQRDRLADQIQLLSQQQTMAYRKRMQRIARWYRQPQTFESLIANPDAVAMAAGLLENDGEKFSTSDQAIAGSVRRGVRNLNQDVSPILRLIQLLTYPAVIFYASLGLVIGFSYYISPQFEEMFGSFGIQIPAITQFVLETSRWVRANVWLLVASASLTGLLLIALVLVDPKRLPPFLQQFVEYVTGVASERQALASFAEHLANLRTIGLGAAPAIRAACGHVTIRPLSARYESQQTGAPNGRTARLLPDQKYRLLDHAIQHAEQAHSPLLLQQLAAYYRQRSTTIGVWWFQWLALVIQCSLGFLVFLIVAAFFMPLISIVGGLAGN